MSKYFPCVRPSVRACVRPPTDKRRVYTLCKTTLFCGILVVFCSYLEYNAVTPSSSYAPFHSLVLYRFLHAYLFSCTEVLSMYDLRFVLSPYVCMYDIPIPALYVFLYIDHTFFLVRR